MTAEIWSWQASAFDPDTLRMFSILPEEDADEGYCVRHDREMQQIDPLIHHNGGLYTTADGWSVYSCPTCRQEVGPQVVQFYERCLTAAFLKWDDAGEDVLEGTFKYVGEGEPEDLSDRDVSIDTGGEAGE